MEAVYLLASLEIADYLCRVCSIQIDVLWVEVKRHLDVDLRQIHVGVANGDTWTSFVSADMISNVSVEYFSHIC